MKMKNVNSNKNKKIVLTTLSLLSAASIATTLVTSSISSSNIINNKDIATLKDKSSRIVSSNSSISAVNPDQVFYASKDLSKLDPWTPGASGGQTNPYNSANAGSINQENVKILNDFNTNINKIQGTSPELTILKQMSQQIQNYISFRKYQEQYVKSGLDKPVLEGGMPWENIKQSILNSFSAVESFSSIEHIDEINSILTKMSGITVGANVKKIRNITNKTLTKFDITASSSGGATNPTSPQPLLKTPTQGAVDPNTSLSGVDQVAGANFKTLVKVAELDLTQNKTWVLNFSYKSSSSTMAANAKLIIKNDQGQISSATDLKTAYSNLDIFGRYIMDSSVSIGVGSYKSNFENIVLVKKDNTLDILVRMSTNDIIENMEFSTDDPTYGQPTRFGILDVQATNDLTFLDIISNISSTPNPQPPVVPPLKVAPTKVGQLMTPPSTQTPPSSNNNQIEKVQFFSNNLYSTIAANSTSSSKKTRNLTFYQGKGQSVKLRMNFATTNINYGSPTPTCDYKLITSFSNGVDTNEPILLTLDYEGTPTNISPGSYPFYVLLKEQLSSDMQNSSLSEVSKITLKSEAKGTLAKQTLSYLENFYGIGTREYGWIGVSTQDKIEINISDLTEKIFFEEPEQFKQSTEQTTLATSTTYAQEQTDTRTNVVQTLGELYKKWYDTKDDQYKYELKDIPYVELLKTAGDVTGINVVRKDLNGTGNAIVHGLNTYWKELAKEIWKITDKKFDWNNINRFNLDPEVQNINNQWVTNSNTATNIVNSYLIGNSEYIPNLSLIQVELTKAVEAWSNDAFNKDPQNAGQIPTLSQLEQTTVETLKGVLVKLIQIQYSAIVNEFRANQLLPVYDKFMDQLDSKNSQPKIVSIVANPSSILEFVPATSNNPRLIKYKQNGWNSILTTGSLTLKQQFASFFELMNFGQENGGVRLIDSIINEQMLNNKYKSFENVNSLLSREIQGNYAIRLSQLQVFEKVFSYFGYSFASSYNKLGTQLRFEYQGNQTSMTLANVVEDIINKLAQKSSYYKPLTDRGYDSYWLDNIISGANVVASLNWKLSNINTPLMFANLNSQKAPSLAEQQKLENRINNILVNAQASQSEQASWSNAIGLSWDFNNFATQFSGRNNSNVLATFGKVVDNQSIFAKRVNEFNQGEWAAITQTLKLIWWIIVGLVGVGVITTATIGITSKSKQIKLSSHPVIKWLLFGLIVLGIASVAVAVVFGLVPTILL